MEEEYRRLIKKLKDNANPKNVEGMARFGISAKNTFGISIPFLRNLAKKINKEYPPSDRHLLSLKLWNSSFHEARILASLVDEPGLITEKQMDEWANDFDSWDVCDQVCMNLFDETKFFEKKIINWAKSDKEFVRRAAFTLIAVTAVHNKELTNKDFELYFSLIKKYSTDERNFVKKAVNWALRQIGKRNEYLRKQALRASYEILEIDNKAAKWIAKDAIKELAGK